MNDHLCGSENRLVGQCSTEALEQGPGDNGC